MQIKVPELISRGNTEAFFLEGYARIGIREPFSPAGNAVMHCLISRILTFLFTFHIPKVKMESEYS